MAGLRPPFAADQVTVSGLVDAHIRLPDRYLDGVAAPARFEGAHLSLVHITPASGMTTVSLTWPADGVVRSVDLTAADAATLGVTTLLELSLLPFALADVLRSMAGGVPTFYLGYAAPAYPGDGGLVRANDAAIAPASAWFGIAFQDRAALAPAGWFERIAMALRPTLGADAALWDGWATAFSSHAGVRLLGPQGRPIANTGVTLTVSDGSGTTISTDTRVTDPHGDVAGFVFPTAGQSGVLSVAQPAGAIPLLSLIEPGAISVAGQNALTLPPSFAGGHLQSLDFGQWFSPHLHDDPWGEAIGARFRLNSRMQPLVDGIPVYETMYQDITRTKGIGGQALFGGWAFTDFPIIPSDPTTSLLRFAPDVVAAGGDIRVLVTQFLQASDATLDALSQEAAIIYTILFGVSAPIAKATAETGYSDTLGLAAYAMIAGAVMVLFLTEIENGAEIGDALRKVTEQTPPDYFGQLIALNGPNLNVRRSAHPVTMADNPVSQHIPLPDGRHLGDLQDKWGVFHQKIQVIRHADAFSSGDPDRHIGYVGGIDLNEDRVDSPGHQGAAWRKADAVTDPVAAPFHDVHCRVTGPAASEVFQVFASRYRRDSAGDATAAPVLATPTPHQLDGTGRDVMQISQTSFRPAPGSGTGGFDWAPNGNATTYGTILNAIRAAQELIYIEEQYMVPDNGYIEALVEAADHCQRLVIVLPSFLEIFFADRRRGAMFERMATKWGDRMLIGTPIRRPVLAPSSRAVSSGRLSLVASINSVTSTIYAAPATRAPTEPCFIWIGGELMYVTKSTAVNGPDGNPAAELTVLRGGLGTANRWCPNLRPHNAGEPITASQPAGIYVHAKTMMVDDIFVGIGSTNINRRGFFHDGEIHAFAIPQDLKGAADNPARDLRTRLWAEQLGLVPEMGAALFADPIAGFELFRRSNYQGNRFVPLSQLKVPVPTLDTLAESLKAIPTWAAQLLQFTVQGALEAESDAIFNTLSDATTTLDPAPTPGPDL